MSTRRRGGRRTTAGPDRTTRTGTGPARRHRAVAVALLGALLLAGCGGDDAADTASGEAVRGTSSGAWEGGDDLDVEEPASDEDAAEDDAWAVADAEVAEAEVADDAEVAEDQGADTTDAGDADDGDRDAGATDGGDTEMGEGDGATVRPVSQVTNRRVIRTAELVLEVDDPGAAAGEVTATATRAGGFVAEADLERDAEGVVRGTITLRVPTSELQATVEDLDALARAVPVRRIDERDVTAESVDLEAQLTNLRTYEDELRALLRDVRETTDRPDDLLTVYERIRGVRADIERIDAQLAVLSDQVALSTIRVSIVPAAQALPVTDPTWQPGDTVRDALAATARTLAGVADAAIWLVLTAVPVLAVTVLPVAVVLLAWWRWRRRRAGTATSGPGSGGPPAGQGPPTRSGSPTPATGS
jgi:hypothetical protein